ncbi:MAG: endonuclease, partial [Alistipes sp.]|nr:endonuclease [Alistipes sp.]
MAEEYYSDYKRFSRSRHRSLLTMILDGFMTLLTIGVGVMLAFTLLVPFINPSEVAFFPLLGLIAPAVYVAALVLALYWVIRWSLIHEGLILLQ